MEAAHGEWVPTTIPMLQQGRSLDRFASQKYIARADKSVALQLDGSESVSLTAVLSKDNRNAGILLRAGEHGRRQQRYRNGVINDGARCHCL
jgi:hypothetical protein